MKEIKEFVEEVIAEQQQKVYGDTILTELDSLAIEDYKSKLEKELDERGGVDSVENKTAFARRVEGYLKEVKGLCEPAEVSSRNQALVNDSPDGSFWER